MAEKSVITNIENRIRQLMDDHKRLSDQCAELTAQRDSLKAENRTLQERIEELRLIDRAKCVLIQRLGLSESQAHRYIEKQAMDRRLTRAEVSRSLLQTYE